MDLSPLDLSRFTSRLHIRLLQPSDRKRWIEAETVSADHFAQWMPTRPAGTLDQLFEAQIQRSVEGFTNGTQYVFIAQHRADGTLAAFVTLNQVFRGAFQNAFAGWRVCKPYTGQGIGSEAVTALLDLAFDPSPHGLGLHRVQANIIPTNTPSLKLARRVGFREEGYAVRYLEIAGQWQDHVMFAKLAEEHLPSQTSE